MPRATSSHHNPPRSITRFPRFGAVAIRWFDEDFEPVAAFRQSLGESPRLVKRRKLVVIGVKKPSALGDLGWLVSLLQRLKVGRLEQRLANGSTWNGTGFVFIQADSKSFNPAKVSKDFSKIRKAAGLKHAHLHDERNSHASMLLNANENAKDVSERLGHGSAQITWASTRIRFQTPERRPLGGLKSRSEVLARRLERNAIMRVVSRNVANLLPFRGLRELPKTKEWVDDRARARSSVD